RWPMPRAACWTPNRRGKRRDRFCEERKADGVRLHINKLPLGPAKGGRVLLEQLDDGARSARVRESDRAALAISGAHAGNAARLPVGLTQHVPNGRNLLHDRFVDPVGLEAVGMTARTQQPLRKESGPTLHATPDADAWSHAATTMILVSRVRSAAERDPGPSARCAQSNTVLRSVRGTRAEHSFSEFIPSAPGWRPPPCRHSDTSSCHTRSSPRAGRLSPAAHRSDAATAARLRKYRCCSRPARPAGRRTATHTSG